MAVNVKSASRQLHAVFPELAELSSGDAPPRAADELADELPDELAEKVREELADEVGEEAVENAVAESIASSADAADEAIQALKAVGAAPEPVEYALLPSAIRSEPSQYALAGPKHTPWFIPSAPVGERIVPVTAQDANHAARSLNVRLPEGVPLNVVAVALGQAYEGNWGPFNDMWRQARAMRREVAGGGVNEGYEAWVRSAGRDVDDAYSDADDSSGPGGGERYSVGGGRTWGEFLGRDGDETVSRYLQAGVPSREGEQEETWGQFAQRGTASAASTAANLLSTTVSIPFEAASGALRGLAGNEKSERREACLARVAEIRGTADKEDMKKQMEEFVKDVTCSEFVNGLLPEMAHNTTVIIWSTIASFARSIVIAGRNFFMADIATMLLKIVACLMAAGLGSSGAMALRSDETVANCIRNALSGMVTGDALFGILEGSRSLRNMMQMKYSDDHGERNQLSQLSWHMLACSFLNGMAASIARNEDIVEQESGTRSTGETAPGGEPEGEGDAKSFSYAMIDNLNVLLEKVLRLMPELAAIAARCGDYTGTLHDFVTDPESTMRMWEQAQQSGTGDGDL